MPREYKTKQGAKKREKINSEIIKNAVHDIIYAGKSIRGTAKTYNLSPMTLKRYTRKKKRRLLLGTRHPNTNLITGSLKFYQKKPRQI